MIIHDVSQNSPEWLALRAAIPTASEASKLITSTGEPSKSMQDYAEALAGNMYAGKDLSAWEGNSYTERGHEIEDHARAAYELQNSVDVVKVGFVTDDLKQWGCSPDGLIGDDGLLELKCLPKRHIKTLLYFKKHGKPPTEYIPQCQMQLFVTGRTWNDLFFYHDDLPSLRIRITPDSKLFTALESQLKAVIAERNLIYKALKEL